MVGKISTKVELKVPIKRLWSALTDSNILHKALPQFVKSIEVLEGNNFSVGTTRKLKFGTSVPHATYLIEKIEAVEHGSHKLVTSIVEGGSIGKDFSYTRATVKLSASTADSTILNWEFEYEAIVANPPLEKAKEGSIRTFKAIEAYLLSNKSLYT